MFFFIYPQQQKYQQLAHKTTCVYKAYLHMFAKHNTAKV